ncbi:MAG: transporter substrate-binding domain-containing protein [Deltaproteobacteria bacterium]|nr:transporter substrate-binding domain-containing protein [Deltaproteobacteria bacterium]
MYRRIWGGFVSRSVTSSASPPQRTWVYLGLVLTLGGFLAGCSSRQAGVDPLIVGMELAYPPFEMTDSNGSPTGVSVDLTHALGAYLNRPVRIENIPFDGLIPALKTGKIDLIISSMTATPERRQSIDFSDPYLKTGLCLLVGIDSNLHSISDADKEGRTVAVKKGTTGHAYAATHIRNATVLVLDKEAACVLEVVQGKADAFIYDQMSIYKTWRRYPDRTVALLKPFQEESWAIGLRKGTDRLRTQVNGFLSHFRKSGGFDRLADKYLSEQKEAFRRMGYPFYF